MLARGTAEEVEEFERLLSERFETDPSRPGPTPSLPTTPLNRNDCGFSERSLAVRDG